MSEHLRAGWRALAEARWSDDPEKWRLKQEGWDSRRGVGPIERTKPFDGYLLHLEAPDPEGYRYIYATQGGQYVGEVYFGPALSVPDPNLIEPAVEVHPEHRRRGLASAMYQWAEEVSGKRMIPSPGHSDLAEAFWGQPHRPFGSKAASRRTVYRGFSIKVGDPALWRRYLDVAKGGGGDFRFLLPIIEGYRGDRGFGPTNFGVHWSENRDTAVGFATGRGHHSPFGTGTNVHPEGSGYVGIILKATVGDEAVTTDPEILKRYWVWESEAEVSLRTGATINLISMAVAVPNPFPEPDAFGGWSVMINDPVRWVETPIGMQVRASA